MTQKDLSNLKPAAGSNREKKRLGRGIGSGWGKTAGKGHKGQLARKGGKVRPGFEGGQNPLYRRLPKRGFTNIFGTKFQVINLDQLEKLNLKGQITPEVLKKEGLIKNASLPVKLLGRGKLSKSVSIKVHQFSKTAKEAVEKVGGKVEEI